MLHGFNFSKLVFVNTTFYIQMPVILHSSIPGIRVAGVKRNFWLQVMYACTKKYSTYQILWENWWL